MTHPCQGYQRFDIEVPMGAEIRLVEVFPRDGLQALNPKEYERLATNDKIALCRRLSECGIPEIEVTNFAHPARIPQTSDAEHVVVGLGSSSTTVFRTLVPNMRGLERAIAARAQKVSFFIVCSETYQKKNVGMDIETNLQEIQKMKTFADNAELEACVGIGTAFVCPYEGRIQEDRVIRLVERFFDMGFKEIGVADSAGLASPRHVYHLCRRTVEAWPEVRFGLHLHDRHGLAMVNVIAGLEAGIRRYETSLMGVGAGIAMPNNERAMGNTATEHVLYLMDSLNLDTGVDRSKVVKLARETAAHLELDLEGFMFEDRAALASPLTSVGMLT